MAANLHQRVKRMESLSPPARKRTIWLCVRVPESPDASKIAALEADAASAGMALHQYHYEGEMDPWEELSDYYVGHDVQQMPHRLKMAKVREMHG